MARQNGRDLRVKRGATVIAVLNTKTIKIDNAEVDVTGDTDQAFITVLDRPGTRRISIDASGFTDSDTLRDVAVTGTGLLTECTIEWLSNGDDAVPTVIYAVIGDFFMSSFQETGGSDGALEFSCSLASSGAFDKVSL